MLKVLEIAQAEVGYLEKATLDQLDEKTANAGSNNYTKYARDHTTWGTYHASKQGLAWCDMFVDWCFITAYGTAVAMTMTGQVLGGYGAGCTESANYYKQLGNFYTSDPQVGDQIFFTSNAGSSMYHTGLVYAVDDSKVYTIEGNTSSASGVVANGGAVAEKSYSLLYSQIGGYGRPDYTLTNESEGETVTYEQFKEYMTTYLQEVQEYPANTYSAEALAWMQSKGYMQGDESGNLMPQSTLTREQYATVEYRKAQAEGMV